jgi:NADH-quinone oxidoreductase subunit L
LRVSLWRSGFLVLKQLLVDGAPAYDGSVYTWLVSDGIRMEVGFWSTV